MKNKTLKEIIAMADELNPNSYSNEIKAQWVNEVESYLQTEIYNVAPIDVVSYITYEECKDKELSLDAVNDKIYLVYLQAMIDFSNKEYQAFNNDVALYNSYLDIYAKWYVRTHGEGEKLISGMYLSAYGIAVKNGFEGTEEEWLLSLKGDKGEKGDGLEIKGVVNNVSKLPDNAKVGDIWLIPVEIEGEPNEWGITESDSTGSMYIWNGSDWEYIGTLKGEKGDKGEDGPKGDKGDAGRGITSINSFISDGEIYIDIFYTDDTIYRMSFPQPKDGKGIEKMAYYDTNDSGDVGIYVWYTDGTTGIIWIPGLKGKDGYTPVKGVDYWTEEDKAEIISEIPTGDKWELIDTITTTENVKSVSVMNEPDGTPYNFKKLLVLIKNVTTGASGNAYVQIQGYQMDYTVSYYLLTHTNAMVYLAIEGNLAWVETHSGLGDYSQFHNYGKPLPMPKNTFNALQIKGNGTILTGTTFEIWGVRNDENV